MASPATVALPRSGSKTESYVDNKRKEDVRQSNILSARTVADTVRTSLGPRGMDKMISTSSGDVIITNDGATILNKMEVLQPAAKMLVELSKSQDSAAGDGTTTVVVIAGALLRQCLSLLSHGIHPTVISDSLHKAALKAVDVLTAMAVPVELSDRESLIKSASTSLNSKVVSQYSSLLAPLAVDSVLSVVDPAKPDIVDLRDIKIVKKLGGTVDGTQRSNSSLFNETKIQKWIGMMSKWADLPCDVFFQIMCRLCSDDTIISSAVCKSWHSLLKSVEKLPLPPSCPWLMLAEESEQIEKINDEESRTRGFFNLRNAKVHYFKLPEVSGRRCFGASFGWLLTIGTDLQINLLHPFSKYLLCLPPVATFRCQYEFKVTPERLRRMFLKKVVLSRSPWNPATRECDCDCVVMVIYGEYQQLAFTRPGYKAWVDITNTRKRYADIAFYKGKFYAVHFDGTLVVCRIDDNKKLKAKAVAPPPEEINLKIQIHIQKYIVESSGDLLLVTRFRGGQFYSRLNDFSYEEDSDSDSDYSESESSDEDSEDDFENEDSENAVEDEDSENAVEDEDSKDESDEEGFAKNDNPYVTIGFTVQKLKRCTQEGSMFKYKWVKVDSLGDQALFVGNSSSLSLTASSLNGIKPNCIYFTDDDLTHFNCTRNGGGFDMGVYRMEDASFMPHYSGQSLSFFCSPLWYM